MDVALISCLTLPEPDRDMAPLQAALDAAGISSAVLAWDDPAVDWSAPRLALLRATWNYPLARDAFLDWAARVAAVTRLWNPLDIVRWSSHKRYLLELEARGIPIAPTALVPRGSDTPLAELLDARGWDQVVIKPAVSAASYRTIRVNGRVDGRVDPDELAAGEAHLRALAAERDVLVQQYMPSVAGHGERAVVWIDGAITHAVRKSPRFQGDPESVSAAAVDIAPAEAALAERTLATIDAPLLYGRVDMAPGPDGAPVVMELELIEPSLFFLQGPAALDRLVRALARELAG